jgi:hypothetical protein
VQAIRDVAVGREGRRAHQAELLTVGDDHHRRPRPVGCSGNDPGGLEGYGDAERIITGPRRLRHGVEV